MRNVILALAVVSALTILLSTPVLAQVDGRARDIVRFGEDLEVEEGEVASGDIVVFGGDAIIAGTVEGDVTVLGGDAELKSTALVDGGLTVLGGRIEREPGARVRGGTTSGTRFLSRGGFWINPTAWYGFSLAFNFLLLLGTLALGAIVVAFLPVHTEHIALFIAREPWQSIGVGFLALLVVVPAMILLAITIIGIPLIPLFVILVIAAYVYGYFAASLLIGKRIFEVSKARSSSLIVETLVGILVVGLLRFIPFIGGLIALVVGILGFGAVLLTKFGTGRPWFKRREEAKIV
jgi:hypothetical protein